MTLTRRKKQRRRIAELYNKACVCFRCGKAESITLDHVYPTFALQARVANRLQLLCRECHHLKTIEEQWMHREQWLRGSIRNRIDAAWDYTTDEEKQPSMFMYGEDGRVVRNKECPDLKTEQF